MNITTRQFLKSAGVAAVMLACGVTIASAQTVVIEERGRMPPLKVEVIPAAPGPGFNWVPGHWAWRGGWVWVPGHHIRGVVAPMPAEIVEVVPARPSPAHYWVKGHHIWEGGRWVWHAGIWVR